MVKKTMEIISNISGHINQEYNLYTNNIKDIYNASNNAYELICNGFTFGYEQGMKAAKAEIRKAV